MSSLVTPAPAPLLKPFASVSATTPPPGAERWRRQHGLTRALSSLLVVAAGVQIALVVAIADHLAVLDDLSGDRVGSDNLARVGDADDSVRSVALVWLLLAVVILAVFVVWTWRAAKNNDALGRDQPRLGTEWAIAGWLIPVANLAMPVLVVQDLWRGSTARIPRGDMRWRITDRSALVGWWWGTWIVAWSGGMRSLFGTTAERTPLDTLRTGDWLAILTVTAGVAAAVLAILVVRAVTSRQEQTLETQRAAWSAAHRE